VGECTGEGDKMFGRHSFPGVSTAFPPSDPAVANYEFEFEEAICFAQPLARELPA
jgi:hypothetical protein